MAVSTVSGGGSNQTASQALSDSKTTVSEQTSTLLANVPAAGGVFLVPAGTKGDATGTAILESTTTGAVFVVQAGSTVQAGAAKNVYVIGDGAATIQGGSGSGTIVGGAAGALLGTSTVAGASYQLLGSTGNDTIIAVGGTNTIQGGGGTNVHGIFGGTNTVGVGQVAGAKDTAFVAGGSNTIFIGSAGGTVGLSSGSSIVVGGAASDTIIAAQGSSTIAGGAGKDLFLFTKIDSSGGKHVVTDFGVGGTADTVAIVGLLPVSQASIDSLLSGATVSGSSVTLNLGSNITVTFQNTTVDALRGNIVLG